MIRINTHFCSSFCISGLFLYLFCIYTPSFFIPSIYFCTQIQNSLYFFCILCIISIMALDAI